jgi:hypothetical protein
MRGQNVMKKPVRKSAAASAVKKPAGNPNPAVDAVFGACEGKIAGAAPADLRHG